MLNMPQACPACPAFSSYLQCVGPIAQSADASHAKGPDPRVIIPIPKELIKQIDEYRWANRLPSRAEAIRQLVELGLKTPKT